MSGKVQVGDRVRATKRIHPSEYPDDTETYEGTVTHVDGDSFVISTARWITDTEAWEVTVLERALPPLPEEPPVGTYAKQQIPRDDSVIFKRYPAGWFRVGDLDSEAYTWAELHDGRATVTVLVPAGEDQGKYELAITRDGHYRGYQHVCGHYNGFTSNPNGESYSVSGPAGCAHCNVRGQWVSLYVRSGSDAD